MYLYSKSTRGVYLAGIHSNIPSDAKKLAEDRYLSVIARHVPGKVIANDEDGLPILVDMVLPATLTREQVETQRSRAYADPVTGSDRYFSEAIREELMGNLDECEAARALGVKRYLDIKAEHPWPAGGQELPK